MPTVVRAPTVAPGTPTEVLTPDLLTLKRRPGNCLMLLRKRKPIAALQIEHDAINGGSDKPW